MAVPFSQTVIATVWDFDKTLIPGNMQSPLFAHFGVDEREFWAEVEGLRDFYRRHGAARVNEDTLYLNHVVEYVRAGRFEGLSNELLHRLGGELVFHAGMPELLEALREIVRDDPDYQRAEISVEHYIVSTGLRPMIEGSAIRPHVDDVWACEFIEAHHPPGYRSPEQAQLFPRREITALAYAIDNTSKTRALFEINKGSNKRPEIHVNAVLPREARRIPFENMVYVADGPSDIPAWSVVKGEGGLALGVYQRGSQAQFEQISALQRDGRIHAFAEADYRPDSTAWLWLTTEVRRIADRIVEERELALRRALRPPARHISEPPPRAEAEESERQLEAESRAPEVDDGSMPETWTRADEVRRRVQTTMTGARDLPGADERPGADDRPGADAEAEADAEAQVDDGVREA